MANTTSTANKQQNAVAAAIATFMKYAATRSLVQTGTISSGASGSGTSGTVSWANVIPTSPVWCRRVRLQVTLPITLTIAAGASITISPYAPFSAMLATLQLSGAPAWPLTPLSAFFLDWITQYRNFDPSYAGLGVQEPTVSSNPYQDDGGAQWNFNSYIPGQTITNSGTTAEVLNFTWQFTAEIVLQRRMRNLIGTIPFGDPKNRPLLNLQLAPLIGAQPEQNAFVNSTSGSTTAVVGSGGATINATYPSYDLDLLPAGVAVPNPQVGLGLTVSAQTLQISAAGKILYQLMQDAALYEKIHGILVNSELPIRADYFGLWTTQEQRDARWEFDASVGTFHDYYAQVHEHYGRFLPLGDYVADLFNGENPDNPGLDPYQGQMSPDVSYAQRFGVAPTPAMSLAVRVPSGTSISSAYFQLFQFELVTVPY
jgi:hypothetical protein